MLQLVLKQRSLVSGGRGAFASKYVFGLRRRHAHLLAKTGDHSTAARELAARYRKAPEQIEDILARLDQHDAAFDGAGDSSRAPAERLHDEPELGREEALHRAHYRAPLALAVAEAKARLNERERYIVEHRLMADDEARCSLGAIGRKLGVSRERSRQLEQAVKTKLRARLSPLIEQLDLQPAA
jgi:RNA polymerase sigma-32 factor